MSLPKESYMVVDVPALPSDLMSEFEHLPLDKYGLGPYRTIRLSQYMMHFDNGSWHLALLPKRGFVQSGAVNSLRGGVLREREQLRIDPTVLVDFIAKQIPIDPVLIHHVNVNQVRVRSNAEVNGISVAEGPHRDGHEFGAVVVSARHNVSGGETQLMPLGGGEPFFRTILEPNQAVVYEDPKMWHYATDIEHLTPEGGYRDLWILAFNRWDHRKYGPSHEQRAMAAAA